MKVTFTPRVDELHKLLLAENANMQQAERAYSKLAIALEKESMNLAGELECLLPMARAWADEHDVGNNKLFVSEAERTLAERRRSIHDAHDPDLRERILTPMKTQSDHYTPSVEDSYAIEGLREDHAAELSQTPATATMDRAVAGEAPRPDGSPSGTLRQPAIAAPTSCITQMDAAQLQAIAKVCDMYLHEDYGHRLRNISTAITDHLRAAPADHPEPDAKVISEGMSDRALIDRFTNCPVGTHLYKAAPIEQYYPLLAEINALRTALKWYADEHNYHWKGAPMTPYIDGKPDPLHPAEDMGRIARAALAGAAK